MKWLSRMKECSLPDKNFYSLVTRKRYLVTAKVVVSTQDNGYNKGNCSGRISPCALGVW